MLNRPTSRPRSAHLDLPDGRGIDFEVRISARARSLHLRMSLHGGLVVTVPAGVPWARVVQLVAGKAAWIAKHLSELDRMRRQTADDADERPEGFDLPALAESWTVEYRATSARSVGARMDPPGRILVLGAVESPEACRAALRRWLRRHAKDRLAPWLDQVAQQTGLDYLGLSVKSQHTRWGSCTHQGRINLNCKLLFLPSPQVRYVMVHELCHRLEPNHSRRFWAHVRRLEPEADALHEALKEAWRLVPRWAERAGKSA